MPKIRGIKPDFWTDDAVVELTIPARLLFIGLWTYACDNGHLEDKPKQIKMRLLPGDDVNAAELLRELEESGRIRRDQGVITIPNFTHHQKPDKRYFQTCNLDGCARPGGDSQPETRGGPHETTTRPRSGPGVVSQGPRVDGDGDGDGDGELMVKGAGRRGTQLPADFKPSTSIQEMAIQQGVDLRAEFPQFVDYHRAKGSTFKDWDAALRTWIRNAAKFRKGPAPVLTAVKDPAQLPPVEENWMRRPRT